MSFKITIQPSGHSFDADVNETVLDAALRQSIDLSYGCRGGACGSCEGFIIEGQVHYDEDPIALSDEMKKENKALFCMAIADSDLQISAEEITGLKDIVIKQLRCRVDEKTQLNHDVISLKIKLAGDERLQYHAGQYIEFILEDNKRRAFSIANAPHHDDLLELHIRHVEGGLFTDFLFADMPAKTMLKMEGPLGSFFLREDTQRPIILMGGGTGFGPLKAMIEHINHIGFNQTVHLFMGVRALEDLYMHEMAEEWIKENSNIKFTAVLSDAKPEDNWQGETGFVHQSVLKHYDDLSSFDIYMSGPPPMVHAAVDAFEKQNAHKQHMYSDAFEYSSDAQKAIDLKPSK